MIVKGEYRKVGELYRPYIRVLVKNTTGNYLTLSFLLDTGADRTFLPYRFIKPLGVDLKQVSIKDDVGGIGGKAPYFEYNTTLIMKSETTGIVFAGDIGIFLEPHSGDVPLLGRDILDYFTLIFDKRQGIVLLLDETHSYEIK